MGDSVPERIEGAPAAKTPHVIEYIIYIPILFQAVWSSDGHRRLPVEKHFSWFAIEKNGAMDSNSGKKGTRAVSLAILSRLGGERLIVMYFLRRVYH